MPLSATVAASGVCGHNHAQHRVSPYPPAAERPLFPPEKENALQAEATAVEQPEPEPEPWEIRRLGETVEYGSLLLRLLELHGWTVLRLPAIGGVIVIASRRGQVVERHGASVADVACDVFTRCSSLQERA